MPFVNKLHIALKTRVGYKGLAGDGFQRLRNSVHRVLLSRVHYLRLSP